MESGRFNNTKLEDRICEFCNINKVEDEFHFLMECDFYNDFRKCLFMKAEKKNHLFSDLTVDDKFKFLLQDCNFYVSRYLKDAWNRRKDKLYN